MSQSGPYIAKDTLYRLVGARSDEPRIYRIVEVTPDELENMKLVREDFEGEAVPTSGHFDADTHGSHSHDHGGYGGDHDHDMGTIHDHVHPV